jgi:hypothetical protein
MPGQNFKFRRIYLLFIAGAIVLLGALFVGLIVTQAAPKQPFPYTHAPHIAKGIPCVYCHSGAASRASAGLPTKQKCQGCHTNMKADTPLEKQWIAYAAKQTTIQWVPVAIQPDFVYFSHQPHLAAGIDCQKCHGDVSKMTDAKPQRYVNMGYCLDCHKKTDPQHFTKLSDCATCHK